MAEGRWRQGSGEKVWSPRKKSLVEDLSFLTTASLATATMGLSRMLQPPG